MPRSRKNRALPLAAAIVCLAFAGVMLPKAILRKPSQIATAEPPDAEVVPGNEAAAFLRDALTPPVPLPMAPVRGLFHWPEELTANKTIEELWKEEEKRPPSQADPDPVTPESRPIVSPEEIALARAIVVKGVLLGPKGPTALLSVGKVRPNDAITGTSFRVESIDAQSVTLVSGTEKIVLPTTASRPGRVRTLQR